MNDELIYVLFCNATVLTTLQADRKHCTDDFSRQINFILIFNLLK